MGMKFWNWLMWVYEDEKAIAVGLAAWIVFLVVILTVL